MIHTLFPNKVRLEPVTHTYSDGEGNSYMSVSALLKMIAEKFEDTPAYKIASEEKRLEWKQIGKESADHGTRIHNALELFSNTGQILKEDEEYEGLIKDVSAEYNEYHKSFNEVCLYNEKYRVAGTTDKICAISNRKDCEVDLADFKTNNRKGITYFNPYKKRLYPPFDHLQDCNYVKYSFQLSIYAYFFEELTGRKVRNLFIHSINAENKTHTKIPVLYLKNDVKLLLDTYAGKIEETINPIQNAFEL